jgi:integrase
MALDFERAKRQLNLIRSEIDSGKFIPSDWTHARIAEMRFENKMRQWINEKEAEADNDEIAFSTYDTYRKYANRYFYPLLSGNDVREINLREFLQKLREYKLAVKYRKSLMGALHVFYSWLWDRGDMRDIPKFPVISGDDTTVRVMLEYKEQEIVLPKLPEDYRAPVIIMMETGLRTGEVCALKIKDIFIDKRYAVIQRTWSGKRVRETTKGKNKKAIPLSSRAIEVLNAATKGRFPEDFIFPIKPKTLQNAWRKHADLSLSLYEATRHSFCTQLVEMGVNTLQAKALMRHSDIRSTEKYFHASVKKLGDIVEQRGKVIQFTRSAAVQGE